MLIKDACGLTLVFCRCYFIDWALCGDHGWMYMGSVHYEWRIWMCDNCFGDIGQRQLTCWDRTEVFVGLYVICLSIIWQVWMTWWRAIRIHFIIIRVTDRNLCNLEKKMVIIFLYCTTVDWKWCISIFRRQLRYTLGRWRLLAGPSVFNPSFWAVFQ